MIKSTDIVAKRLFALLRLALWHRDDEDLSLFEDMDERQWVAVYELSVEHGILAVTFDGVRRLPESLQPDIDTKIQWGYNVENVERTFARQVDAATKLCRFLSEKDIRTMIMKGLSIASYYPDPRHRQFGDIDIYLMGDYELGNQMVKSKGATVRYDFFVHSEFSIGKTNVENHRLFVNPYVNKVGAYVQNRLEQLSVNTVPHTIISGALAPSTEFNALFLTRHATWHYAREGVKLRELCDWALFLHHEVDNMDKVMVMQMLRESGLDRYASIVTGICRTYLGLDVTLPFDESYPELEERVCNDILSFVNPDKHTNVNFVRAFYDKFANRIARKWCYDLVVPDGYYDNIRYSIKNYLLHPLAIFKAKV